MPFATTKSKWHEENKKHSQFLLFDVQNHEKNDTIKQDKALAQ